MIININIMDSSAELKRASTMHHFCSLRPASILAILLVGLALDVVD